MLYTLVLVTALIPQYGQAGGNVSSNSIKGFSTEQACINAGNKITIPAGSDRYTTKVVFTCVPMDI